MLNSETKRKIDNARDILVGKIPVPSAQIELITIALIYKFMSDIDTTNKDLGADGFFVGEFDKYSWSNIMDRKIGAHDRLYLYSEGLDKMGTNPHIPQMFRDIFRNAFLPFKDPQTLDRFLKQINEFSYDNSEELGNAFEYLLSTAGSQGDAGQFRTPRHIIDFVVSVVNPDHTDTILDPACGTAGFLISAYKYIISQNTDKQAGDKLTLTQKNDLTKNFVGYDISHEMVRLSLVNLFLHNFGNPHIYEYDTLTSEERRDDRFDCILANPPFMTPKGGIQPHNKFSVKASKSEVLFVDYMMEHLNPHGKAGIIIPEGIIFQSANAYKSLRKKMIEENFLYAVVSLPSGVFQPYSGVKTSILLFDKEIAKKTDDILFVKIESDGFDLGAQRRETPDKNDLPTALEDIKKYKQAVLNGEKIEFIEQTQNLIVEKSKIIENGDYNLSGERYRISELINSDRPMIELGDVVDYEQPTKYIVESTNYNDEYKTPVLTAGKSFILGYTNETEGIFSKNNLPVIIFDDFTTATKFVDFPFKVKSSAMKILNVKKEKANVSYIYHMIQNIKFNSEDHKRYWISQYSKLKIPLPPLAVQEKIVAELDGYQKIIDGAKQIVKNYKPMIKVDSDWDVVELGEAASFSQGIQVDTEKQLKEEKEGYIRFWRIIDFTQGIKGDDRYISFPGNKYIIKENDVVMVRYGATAGFVGIGKEGALANNLFKIIIDENKLFNKFVYYFLKDKNTQNKIFQMAGGGAMPALSFSIMKKLNIPIPLLEVQKQIVAKIEEEQTMVESAKGLIEVFEGKIKEKIGEVWGEE